MGHLEAQRGTLTDGSADNDAEEEVDDGGPMMKQDLREAAVAARRASRQATRPVASSHAFGCTACQAKTVHGHLSPPTPMPSLQVVVGRASSASGWLGDEVAEGVRA